jgi:sulfate permease, SulP family
MVRASLSERSSREEIFVIAAASAVDAAARRLRQELAPSRLIPTLIFGLVLGTMEVVLAISLAALIFVGRLSAHLEAGIGLGLLSAVVVAVVVASRSSLPGAIGSVQGSTAAVLALIAAGIAAEVPATGEERFLTVVVAIGLTTAATGVFLFALGLLRLGNLIRFMPHPVVGGFLAGTGWLLTKGAIGVLSGVPVSLSTFGDVVAGEAVKKWLPGMAFALILLVLVRRWQHFLLIPGALSAALALFYTVTLLAGSSVSELKAEGWLLGPFPGTGFWEPWTVEGLERADWSAIVDQMPNMATVVLVGAVALLLNTSGIELAVDGELDLNRELRASGGANVAAGLGGGIVGFPALSLTVLAHRSRSGRLVGVAAGLVCAVVLVLGGSFLSLLPRIVVGGLLLFLGLAFLVEWVYDAWSKLPQADYAVVVLILVVIGIFGFLPGVAVGLIVAVALFVVDYSRTDVVKHAFSGGSYRSKVEREPQQLKVLRVHGEEVFIFELQGFLFFGTANSLLDRIRERALDTTQSPLSFLVLDFRRVNGLDSSAVVAFIKAHRLAEGQAFTLLVTGLSHRVRVQLERGGFSKVVLSRLHVFADLDHAIQWCEDRLLEREAIAPDQPRPLTALLRDGLGLTVNVERLLPYLEPVELPTGHELIHQGEPSTDLYLLESGRLTAVLTPLNGEPVRLRTMAPGTVVGEVAMYLGTVRSASVVTEQPSRVYRLTAEALEAMERDEPKIAGDLHRALARLLAQRLTDSLRTMEALLD